MSKDSRRPSGLLVPAHMQLGKPRAVHCKRERHHVYIGRPSKWGNPFVVDKHGARGECIALYERWLRENAALFAALDELRLQMLPVKGGGTGMMLSGCNRGKDVGIVLDDSHPDAIQ